MFRNQYDTDVTVWSPEGRLLQVGIYLVVFIYLYYATVSLEANFGFIFDALCDADEPFLCILHRCCRGFITYSSGNLTNIQIELCYDLSAKNAVHSILNVNVKTNLGHKNNKPK